MDFWKYHEVKSGWGFDLVMSAITKQKCAVIHEVSMYHPNKPSYYDKGAAFTEMYKILNDVYPKFMKDKYGEECGPYNDQQEIYEIALRGI